MKEKLKKNISLELYKQRFDSYYIDYIIKRINTFNIEDLKLFLHFLKSKRFSLLSDEDVLDMINKINIKNRNKFIKKIKKLIINTK